ncbi:uncharacterized protein BP5553_02332 [Venustampulla echinocandica]|uniref:Uncharacterized protein n=1 Tax=Venustampulla echinocandica TaxID=2656787 RepID=A0A370U3N0_9HELO|nr:uncharacterized protein BP5553_02332 [Venustampulla echinocandica]RDL42353.1 hypothetical protein BP5553_02332 [Venustampulla echinocandica]
MARRQHSQLRPVKTSIVASPVSKRWASSAGSPIAMSSVPFPSPTIVAARAFYLEQEAALGLSPCALQRRQSSYEAYQFPRRHSAVAVPADLAVRLATFTFASPTLQTVTEISEKESKFKAEESDDVQMTSDEIRQNDLVKIRAITSRRSSTVSTSSARDVPFLYIHDRLRDWGSVYLGNVATADVFVNAVSLRLPSMTSVSEEEAEAKSASSNLVTIRARVLPKAKERKPFIIQRQFDIDELRKSIPSIPRSKSEEPTPRLRRSSRHRRTAALQAGNGGQRRNSEYRHEEKLSSLGKGAVPLHVEYALHYLPVLGALLLSGHVRKGDSVDLPIPRPEVWPEVVSYIYTSQPALTAAMKENILFLAGNCSG